MTESPSALSAALSAAINGGDAEMVRWYRLLAASCPLWSRQQDEYEKRWGRQTSEGQPKPTPWSLMSKRAELEANALADPQAVARWYLEVVSQLPDGVEFRYEALSPYLDERLARNLIGPHGIWRALEELLSFAQTGLQRIALSPLRRLLYGSAHDSRAQTGLSQRAVKALSKDSEQWLAALGASGAARENKQRLRLALPFLDSVEVEYLLGDHVATPWRWTAAYLIHDRLEYFGKHVQVATLVEYAFGTGEAERYKDQRGKRAKNPLTQRRAHLTRA